MKKWISKIELFLVKNSSWGFLTGLLGLAFVSMQTGRDLGWSVYLGWVLGWLVLFIPALLFSFFRTTLKTKLSRNSFLMLWSFVFIVYPLLVTVLGVQAAGFKVVERLINYRTFDNTAVLYVAVLMLLLEVLLLFAKKRGAPSKLSAWITNLNVQRVALICLALFALITPWISTFFLEMIKSLGYLEISTWYIYYAIQIFLIYLTYYLYYYIHHHFLFNKLLKEKGILLYAIGLIALVLILTPLCNQLITFLPVVHDLKIHTVGLTTNIFDTLNYTMTITVLSLSLPLIVIIEWYRKENKVVSLEKEKSQAELDLLKQQINPHFFFNTLNNLYSMSLTKDEETPETILQLSELMRYVIYKGKETRVKLSEDIKYIEDYISLQRIRLHKHIDFSFKKEIEHPDLLIAPLLFIILVENAFKHGVEKAEQQCFLHVSCIQKANTIEFTVHNSIEPLEASSVKGIGLQNLSKRLEILYPEKYQLEIEENLSEYKVYLKLIC